MKEIKKKNWYVFYTSPRAEKKVNEYLLSLGYESFLPLKSEFKIWRNRQRKLIKSPLFPSYIFVLATRNDIFDIVAIEEINNTFYSSYIKNNRAHSHKTYSFLCVGYLTN